MAEDFGPNIVTITDEDGNNIDLEFVDALELDGVLYRAFFPVIDESEEGAEDEEEYGLVILKETVENGETWLVPVSDDAELDAVYEKFMESLFEDEED